LKLWEESTLYGSCTIEQCPLFWTGHIWNPVNIRKKYRSRQFSGVQVVFVDKTPIDKNTNGLRVNQGLHKEELGYICSFKRDWKIEGGSTDIESTDSRV